MNVDSADARHLQKIILNLASGFEEVVVAQMPRNRDREYLSRVCRFRYENAGRFGFSRKCVDGINCGFDVVHQAAQIYAVFGSQVKAGSPVAAVGVELLNSLDSFQGGFNRDQDGFFDILGSRSSISHIHHDKVPAQSGSHFQRDFEEGGVQAGKENANHEKVGGDSIFREPAYHTD